MKGAKECGTESAQHLQYVTYDNEHHGSFVNIFPTKHNIGATYTQFCTAKLQSQVLNYTWDL